MSTNLNKASEEDLLKALNTKVKLSRSYLNDTEKFISIFNLTPGNNLVSKRILYKIYKSWSADPAKPNAFTKRLGLHLPSKIMGQQVYFLIKELPADLRTKSLQHLKPKSKIHSKTYKSHFDGYLKKYNITPGNYYLESYVLYYLYDLWVYSTRKNTPLSYPQFSNFCLLYFKSKRTGKTVKGQADSSKVRWFGVNESILQVLPLEHITQIREGRQFMNRLKREKTKKENKTQSNTNV